MMIKPHPFIGKKITKLFFVSFISLLVLILLCIYGNRIIPNFVSNHYFQVIFVAIWVVGIYMFARVWYLLKYVECPNCRTKTVTKSSVEAFPDHHSAYCKHCDIIWDLGVGNSTSD
jgi:hypothetical protein